jgi:hypothetical protein
MPIATIDSWRELDDAVAALGGGRVHSPWVFRGLARSSYPNVSSLARLGEDFPSLERHLIRNFRKYAHRERPGHTVWDWLSLAQHHGLPTRLLDWTFSPFVAAHFATATQPDREGIVYAIDCEAVHAELPPELRAALEAEGALVFTTELLASRAPSLDAFDELAGGEPFALFFEPPSLDERIVNQSAVLSAIADPRHHMDDWLEQHPDAWRAWRIPPEAKAEIRERLDQGNVTERVLMPGLDGLAAWLRRYYAAAPGEPVPEDAELDGGAAMAAHAAGPGTSQGEGR